MGPTDALDCYPLMFLGVVGGTLAPEVFEYSPSRALVIVILGYIGQGAYRVEAALTSTHRLASSPTQVSASSSASSSSQSG
jgi:hypothetical protein